MKLERIRPTVLRATLHAYELAAFVAAARYVVAAAPEEIPEAAREQLRGLLADYDAELHHLTDTPGAQSHRGETSSAAT